MARRLGGLLVCALVLGGCGGGGPSAGDKQFARDLAEAGITAGESMAAVDACTDSVCLRKAGPAAAASVSRRIAKLERGLTNVDDECLHDAGSSILVALRSYRTAAQQAALGRRDGVQTAETRAGDEAIGSLRAFADCAPSSARALSILHATEIINAGLNRINACGDDACLTREGRRLVPLLVAQKRVIDRAFEGEKGCVAAKARRFYDDAMDEAVEMARAVARHDRSAAQVAAANSVRRFADGGRATKDCLG